MTYNVFGGTLNLTQSIYTNAMAFFPSTPKGSSKTQNCLFRLKLHFAGRKSATKFILLRYCVSVILRSMKFGLRSSIMRSFSVTFANIAVSNISLKLGVCGYISGGESLGVVSTTFTPRKLLNLAK